MVVAEIVIRAVAPEKKDVPVAMEEESHAVPVKVAAGTTNITVSPGKMFGKSVIHAAVPEHKYVLYVQEAGRPIATSVSDSGVVMFAMAGER